MANRLIWKENNVVSIELKDNIFVLAQMLKTPYMVFYNCFSENDSWATIELMNIEVLTIKAVTKQFLKKSNILVKENILPNSDVALPELWIRPSAESYMAKIWKGTPDEMEFIFIGDGGALVKLDIVKGGAGMGESINPSISDAESIYEYETTDLAVYPSFNERLYLCYQIGFNVSPEKELVFKRPLDLRFKTYFEIIAGKKSINELGY